MFETLITRDERLRGENMGHYLRASTATAIYTAISSWSRTKQMSLMQAIIRIIWMYKERLRR